MNTTIHLRRMEFFAYHGCNPEERLIGNYFYVDISVVADLSGAIRSDKLEDTVNYQLIYDIVKREMAQPANLLEHLAGRIAVALREEVKQAEQVTVAVAKKNPPLGGKVESAVFQLFM